MAPAPSPLQAPAEEVVIPFRGKAGLPTSTLRGNGAAASIPSTTQCNISVTTTNMAKTSSHVLAAKSDDAENEDRNDIELGIRKQVLIRDTLVKELKVLINETRDKVHDWWPTELFTYFGDLTMWICQLPFSWLFLTYSLSSQPVSFLTSEPPSVSVYCKHCVNKPSTTWNPFVAGVGQVSIQTRSSCSRRARTTSCISSRNWTSWIIIKESSHCFNIGWRTILWSCTRVCSV